jgi:hypothetical protein
VYVISGRKAIEQPVTVLASEGSISAVQGSLKAGDLVVTDGQMTLKPGSVVTVSGGGQGAAAGAPGPGGNHGSHAGKPAS